MLHAVFLIALIFRFASASSDGGDVYCKSVSTPDYYWRDYKGVIPYDALPGGTDKAGRPVYVGQAAVHPVGNIPASIYHGNTSAVTSTVKTYYVNDNVKVLCTGSPEKFSWIKTDTNNMLLITDCEIILGGVDDRDIVYVGRVNYEGEIRLGKVIRKHKGLLIPDKGVETILPNFELLVYDCKRDAHNVSVPFL